MNGIPTNLSGGEKKKPDLQGALSMEAYVAGALNQLFELMSSMAESLDTIALYVERKGESEAIWQPDDLSGGEDEEDPVIEEPK
jgi:hypothetical protein